MTQQQVKRVTKVTRLKTGSNLAQRTSGNDRRPNNSFSGYRLPDTRSGGKLHQYSNTFNEDVLCSPSCNAPLLPTRPTPTPRTSSGTPIPRPTPPPRITSSAASTFAVSSSARVCTTARLTRTRWCPSRLVRHPRQVQLLRPQRLRHLGQELLPHQGRARLRDRDRSSSMISR